ncbi:RICIN domain-containing protein [Streptomyces lunaelactis]|uniref:RICIN domain-containing protein n=1 Tax=Streptomyces lunaelactis TaxID=1535768 RepID=UPI0015853108|nr:RICIN domain-containing protein [Streptomyces lunaelactis]NUK23724.1 ricin-type beta-trefoil lectin domain protein [Streptomyces lunaelactis]
MSEPAAAQANSLMLQAFRALPESWQTTLLQSLEEHEGHTTPLAELSPDTADSEATRALKGLYEAYLRTYAAQAAGRACRHFAAVLDDTVRHGDCPRSKDFDQHAGTCGSCARARTDIVAIHTGQHTTLSKALLPSTTERPASSPGDGRSAALAIPALATPEPTEVPSPRDISREASSRRVVPATPAFAVAAVVAAAAAIAASVTVVVSDDPATAARPPLAASDSATGSVAEPAVAVTATVTVSATATPTTHTSAVARSRDDRVTGSVPPVVAAPPAPSGKPKGLQLVNQATGLCVGIQGAVNTQGAMMQLQECVSSEATQRWERITAGQDTYQLRNTGTGKCLDGTHNGGNVVRVVQWDCHVSDDRSVQLWTFTSDATAPGYRLFFVPQVGSSDYSSHLLGPEDWPQANPPRAGSYLAQLPNYYNSSSFIFAMNDGM